MRTRGCWPWLALALTLAGASARAEAPPALAVFAADPEISSLSLAPDGHAAAYLFHRGDDAAVELLPAGSGAPSRVGLGKRDVRFVNWLDSEHLLIAHQSIVDYSPVLPKQRVTQGVVFNTRTLHSATLLDATQGVPNFMAGGPFDWGTRSGRTVVYLRGIKPGPTFGLFAADAETGRGVELGADSFEAEGWAVTPEGKPVALLEHDSPTHPSRLTMLERRRPADLGDREFRLVGLGRAPDTALVLRGGELLEVGPSGSVTPLQPAGVAAGEPLADTVSQLLIAATLQDDAATPVIFDAKLAANWPIVQRAFKGRSTRLLAVSTDRTQVIAEVWSAGTPASFFWVDLKTKQAQPIGEAHPALATASLAAPRLLAFKASDGLALRALLYLPAGAPTKRPVVVRTTGEPGERWSLQFHPVTQALVSRGYAVLEVDARGALGDGPAVAAAQDGGFGMSRLGDLADALAEAARQGAVDPARACVSGEELGGWEALASVTVRPGPFRCAIAVQPVIDLRLRSRTPDPERRGPARREARDLRRWLGDVSDRNMAALSIADHLKGGTASVLVVEAGEQIDAQEGRAAGLRDALRRAGRAVELVSLGAGAGGLDQPAGRERVLQATLDFLARANPAD